MYLTEIAGFLAFCNKYFKYKELKLEFQKPEIKIHLLLNEKNNIG